MVLKYLKKKFYKYSLSLITIIENKSIILIHLKDKKNLYKKVQKG